METKKSYQITTFGNKVLQVDVIPLDEHEIRVIWDAEAQKYYFSIVDIVGVLTEQPNIERASTYWRVLKNRLKKEGNETVTNCNRLKLIAADGKSRETDVADTEQLLRIVQSIPSKKAEPIKLWLAQMGSQRIDQMQDPELSFQQGVEDYQKLGYSMPWINERMRGIDTRNELTDELQQSGIREKREFAKITDIITKAWSGMTTGQYKEFKGIRKVSLRDNMTNLELALNTLAEASTTEISRQEHPQGFVEAAEVAKKGGKVAAVAREQLESTLGHSVLSPTKAIDYIQPKEELSFEDKKDKDNLY